MVKKLSCVSHGSLKRFPHTFTTGPLDKGTSINDVGRFLMIFDQPTYDVRHFLPYNFRFLGVILNLPNLKLYFINGLSLFWISPPFFLRVDVNDGCYLLVFQKKSVSVP